MTKHEHNEREQPAQSLSEETCRRILALRDARGWSAYHHPKDLAISISLEAAELLELYQWSGEDAECLQKRGAMLEELADIATYAVLLADRLGASLDEAVAQAVRELRQAYPKSSYNCMIQSEDQLIALCAAGREKTSPRIVEIYDEYGRGEQAADYRVMRYRELRDDNGDSAGVVVSSSGYEQEGWNVLENDQMIIVSNSNGTYRLRSI